MVQEIMVVYVASAATTDTALLVHVRVLPWVTRSPHHPLLELMDILPLGLTVAILASAASLAIMGTAHPVLV